MHGTKWFALNLAPKLLLILCWNFQSLLCSPGKTGYQRINPVIIVEQISEKVGQFSYHLLYFGIFIEKVERILEAVHVGLVSE